jgi:hypothetical protein
LYNITCHNFYNNYGGGLLSNYYKGSPQLLLKTLYPEYEWLPWKFTYGVPQNFWDDYQNHKLYMDWLFKELKYEYAEGKTTKDLVKDKRYQKLPEKMQERIYNIIRNYNELDR